MDRSDDIQFRKNVYRNGRRALEKGKGRDANPWPEGSFMWKSWAAGWDDRNAENTATARE